VKLANSFTTLISQQNKDTFSIDFGNESMLRLFSASKLQKQLQIWEGEETAT